MKMAATVTTTDTIMPEFIVSALLASIALTLITGPMGALVVWRRMAYFGETIAHAALLGFALALLTELPSSIGVIAVSIVLAILLSLFMQQTHLSNDTILGILSHSSLAIGLVLLSLIPGVNIDTESILFGDVLAVTTNELMMIAATLAVTLPLLFINWQGLVAVAVQEQLAAVEGRPVKLLNYIFMVLMAVVIAIGMKVVGVILVTALLIIPAATSRHIAKTPEQMAVFATLIGIASVIGGITLSWFWDTPAGPSMVATSSGLFALSLLASK